LNWETAKDCKENEYLDDTNLNPGNWTCVNCPLGGACAGLVTWNNLGPLFGWWKVPLQERGNQGDNNYTMFAQCVYPPACLGAPNPILANQYFKSA